jgi:hypothetical protein
VQSNDATNAGTSQTFSLGKWCILRDIYLSHVALLTYDLCNFSFQKKIDLKRNPRETHFTQTQMMKKP